MIKLMSLDVQVEMQGMNTQQARSVSTRDMDNSAVISSVEKITVWRGTLRPGGRGRYRRKLWWVPLLSTLIFTLGPSFTAFAENTYPQKTSSEGISGWLDIEELSQIRVFTAFRTEETVQETPAAIAVITGEDIRRSGVASIPEAIRLSPGTDVQRINSNRYAIAIRGFNSEFSDKLLVLMDGRSVYTPQFSGVFWDMQDTILEDVSRIEVLRGPGGTAWGANAFSGVINIVSKSARETQGLLLSGSLGSFDQGRATMRYGGKIGEDTYYRVFTQASSYGETEKADGSGLDDQWNSFLGGFRIDSNRTASDSLSLLGGISYAEPLQYSGGVPDRFPAFNGYLLGRWLHSFSATSKLETQLYYDGVRRDMVQNPVNTDTMDIDVRHRFQLGGTHHIHWGANYRFIDSKTENTVQHIYNPSEQNFQQGSIFAEDTLELIPDTVSMTLGCKLEYYTLTSTWEALPNARVAWTPNPYHTLWASASRGVRTPNTSDMHLTINTPFFSVYPNPHPKNEEVWAYQAGYRSALANRFGLDLTGFYYDYSNLSTNELIGNTMPPTFVGGNSLEGRSWGFEASATWQARDWWRWKLNYTLLTMDLHTLPDSTDTGALSAEKRFPENQVLLWWSFQPYRNLDIDAALRYADKIEGVKIPAYWGADLRIAYRPAKNFEVAVVGQNLFDPRHQEWSRSPGFPSVSEIPRSVYAKLTVTF